MFHRCSAVQQTFDLSPRLISSADQNESVLHCQPAQLSAPPPLELYISICLFLFGAQKSRPPVERTREKKKNATKHHAQITKKNAFG